MCGATIRLHIETLDNGGFLATSADVPGLVADGRTTAEAAEIAQGLARKIAESCIEHGDPRQTALTDLVGHEGVEWSSPAFDTGATLWPRKCSMTVKSSVSLTDEQHAFAKTLVDTGRYSSVSAVVQRGIDLLWRSLELDDLERRALQESLSRRQAGEFVAAEEMDDRLSRMIADKRRAHQVSS